MTLPLVRRTCITVANRWSQIYPIDALRVVNNCYIEQVLDYFPVNMLGDREQRCKSNEAVE